MHYTLDEGGVHCNYKEVCIVQPIHLSAHQILPQDRLAGAGWEFWSLDYCHKRGISTCVAVPKEDISVAAAFGSNFKNVPKPAIYPPCSRSANGESLNSVGNNCFDGAAPAPRSAFLLLSGLDVSRLEPHRLGLSRIGRF